MHRIFAKHLVLRAMLVTALGAWASSVALAESPERRTHPWARYDPGAWKQVRVVTETLDPQGKVISTSATHTTERLDSVADDSYALQVDVTVEVAGKRLDSPTQRIEHPLLNEGDGKLAFKNVGRATLTIDDRKIACEVYELKTDGPEKNKTKVYYSPIVFPHVLRREKTTTDAAGKEVFHELIEEVVALGMPHKVLSQIMPTAHVRSVRRHAKGSTVTVSLYAEGVPGGVVGHSSKELDASGRVIRRGVLELVEYGFQEPRKARRRLQQGRPRRMRNP